MRLQKKIPNLWRCVFFDSAQTYTVPGQNALRYDGNASGQTIYTYVLNNPLYYTDPSGYLSIFGHKILPGLFNNDNAKIAVAIGIGYLTGGLVANSAWATCTLSGATWGATAGLVAGGAATGAAMGAMYGGTLESTLKGAAYGAVSAGVASAFAEAGMLGQMIGGGVNGYLQTGNSTGFMRGFAAGGIPQSLGFNDAYRDSGAANLTIGIVRDGIRGGLVSGNSEGIRLGIAYGQVNNAVGHLVGLVSSGFRGPRPFKNGHFEYDNRFGGAITFGNVVSGDASFLDSRIEGLSGATVRDHELAHTNQLALGALYVPAHAIALTVSAVLTGRPGVSVGEAAHSHYNLLECSWISVPASGPGGSCSR